MTTDARTEANRKNAQRSTGPKTPEGKARSSKNALKHGLTSEELILPGENPEAYDARMDEWMDAYDTCTPDWAVTDRPRRQRILETRPLRALRKINDRQQGPPRDR